jgi:large subunit ribosomal protein L22
MAAVEERTSVRAEARYVRTAPRKAQLVAEQIRGRSVPEARTILAFMTRDAARDVERVLYSAVANAEANHGLDGDELYVLTATVGSGPTLKRWRARARGRVARIKKRTCHITIALALPEEQVIPALLPKPAPIVTPAPEPEAEAVEEEEAPKPKRAPRKKASETAETAEEKPKRAPAKKKADAAEDKSKKPRAKKATPKADAAEKPKRKTTRKKKAEDS